MDTHLDMRSYGAYGSRPSTAKGAYVAYTGQRAELDGHAYAMGERVYLVFLRRFVSADRLSPFDAGGINRYTYCGGDPINRIDPSGSAFWSWLAEAAGWFGDMIERVQSATVSTTMARLAGATDALPTMVNRRSRLSADRAAAIASGRGRPAQGGVGRSVGPHGLKPDKYRVDRIDLHGGRRVVRYTFTTDALSSTTLAERRFASGTNLATGQPIQYIKPMWTAAPNGAGGKVYLSDSTTTNQDVIDLVKELAGPEGVPDKDISILYGAHGNVGGGLNWGRSPAGLYRAGGDIGLIGDFGRFWPAIQSATSARRISAHFMGGMTPVDLYSRMNMNEHVVYSTCYGVSDVEVMAMFNLDDVEVFELV